MAAHKLNLNQLPDTGWAVGILAQDRDQLQLRMPQKPTSINRSCYQCGPSSRQPLVECFLSRPSSLSWAGKEGGRGGKECLPCVVCGNWTLSGPGNLVLVRQGKYLKSRCAFAVARNSSLTHPLMGPRPFLALRYRTPSWFLGAQRANLSNDAESRRAEQPKRN